MANAWTRSYGLVPMRPRDPSESHRAASPLELLFDLVFVVAVSVSSVALFDIEAEGQLGHAVGGYLAVFFAIWWAWMGFTWFATSFDTDDWLYRVMTVVQMGGALVIAAGAKAGILDGDITWVVIGYVIMRVVSISQWIRVAISNPTYRGTALRYAVGIGVLQVFWVLLLWAPAGWLRPCFLILVVLEALVPVVAERHHPTPWHPHHITERYGLFTIILLGESILASSNAVFAAIESGEGPLPFITIAVLALVIVAGMWWLYFARPMHEYLVSVTSSLIFGYFHYVIFAAAGAFSAGVEVAVAVAEHETHLGAVVARATLAVPVGLFVLGVWWLAIRRTLPRRANVLVVAIGLVIAASVLVPFSLAVIAGAVVAVVVVVEVVPAPAVRAAASAGAVDRG